MVFPQRYLQHSPDGNLQLSSRQSLVITGFDALPPGNAQSDTASFHGSFPAYMSARL